MAYPQTNYWEGEDDPNDPFALSKRYAPRSPAPTTSQFAKYQPDSPMPFEGWAAPPEIAMDRGIPKLPRSMSKYKQNYIDPGEDPFYQTWENDWNSAAAKRDALTRGKPQLHDQQYEPPTWQKALMTGANAFAGYINAGRRTHVDPISQQQLMRRPKYEQAMDLWETQGKAIDAELSNLQTKYGLRRQKHQDWIQDRQATVAERAAQRLEETADRQGDMWESQINENNAQAEHNRAQAAYQRELAKKAAARQEYIPAGRGQMFKTSTEEFLGDPLQSKAELEAEAEEKRAEEAPGMGFEEGTPEYWNYVKKRGIWRPRAPGTGLQGALTANQEQLQAERTAKIIHGIYEEEHTNPQTGQMGLNERRSRFAGVLKQAYAAAKISRKPPEIPQAAIENFNAATDRMIENLGTRLRLGDLSRADYDKHVQALKHWTPPKPEASTPTPAPAAPAPPPVPTGQQAGGRPGAESSGTYGDWNTQKPKPALGSYYGSK
jgi:hypothetical protein